MKPPPAVFILWSDKFYGDVGFRMSPAVFEGDDVGMFLNRGRAQAAADYKNEHGLGGRVGDWRVVGYGFRRSGV